MLFRKIIKFIFEMNVPNGLRDPHPNEVVRQVVRFDDDFEPVENVPRPPPQFILQDEIIAAILGRMNSKPIPRRMLTSVNVVESLLLTKLEFQRLRLMDREGEFDDHEIDENETE